MRFIASTAREASDAPRECRYAALAGYAGPYFPPLTIAGLHAALVEHPGLFSLDWQNEIARGMDSFLEVIPQPITVDRFEWHWGCRFRHRRTCVTRFICRSPGEVVILLSYHMHHDGTNGGTPLLRRSAAVHTWRVNAAADHEVASSFLRALLQAVAATAR